MSLISENLDRVRENIEKACERSGRNPQDVTLIAVSKTKPVSMIAEAYEYGIRDFGENKPQEMRDKHLLLPGDLRWHMIGRLQRNKVKYVVGTACMIHSVDSEKLAREISMEAVKKQVDMPVLIEVNMAGEETKGGVSPAQAEELVRICAGLDHLKVEGLMTIAPYVTDPEENRQVFRALKNLSIDIGSKNIDNVSMRELSMGMTGDYAVAVEEGATFVRVGTGIFGER